MAKEGRCHICSKRTKVWKITIQNKDFWMCKEHSRDFYESRQ